VKPAPFAYEQPRSVDEAVDLLARHDDEAKVLAGGQSLIPLLNFRLARPERLVDVNRIAELAYVRRRDGALRIGALTRMASLERSPLVAARWPLLVEAARLVGHPQIRSRGTVGGSVAHADPAAELPAALTALGASFHTRSQRRPRTLIADEFFVSQLTTALEPDELLVEITVPPLAPRTGTAIVEHTRVHGDFALGGAAVMFSLAEDGACAGASIVLLAAAPTPVRARAAEESLTGALLEEAALAAAAELAADEVRISGPDARFRRALAAELTRRALASAAERAQAAA
jgi:carbon-monoxide dehydrogenase medium subunit/6-hydroxypseudooxynicotine dehydrogenase subunit alpha